MRFHHYKEDKVRGSRDFPAAYYHIEKEHPRYVMDLHWHMEAEIIHVYSGLLKLFLNDREYLLKEGDTAFAAAGVLHSAQPESCVYGCVVFNGEMLRRTGFAGGQAMDGFGGGDIVFNEYHSGENSGLAALVRALFGSMREQKTGWQINSYGNMCLIWGHLVENGLYISGKVNSNHQVRKIKRVLMKIERDYSRKISLEDMSAEAGMSAKYFCRFFMQITHRSPVEYLNAYRIERACLEIEKGESSITEIAYGCGFNDLSYFIRVFKKHRGITPGQYRKAFGSKKQK